MSYKILFQLKKFPKNNTLDLSCVFFTDRKRCDLEQTIANLPKNSAIIFREYDLSKQKRQELASKILKICQHFNHKILIGKDPQMAKELGANGVHFSDFDRIPWRSRLNRHKNPNHIYSLSCHNLNSVTKAQKSHFDLLFLSPIFPTKSHPNAKIIGLRSLIKARKTSLKPIFALGGINNHNIHAIASNKVSGIAGIEIFQKN